jgi:hypothetical protein
MRGNGLRPEARRVCEQDEAMLHSGVMKLLCRIGQNKKSKVAFLVVPEWIAYG